MFGGMDALTFLQGRSESMPWVAKQVPWVNEFANWQLISHHGFVLGFFTIMHPQVLNSYIIYMLILLKEIFSCKLFHTLPRDSVFAISWAGSSRIVFSHWLAGFTRLLLQIIVVLQS